VHAHFSVSASKAFHILFGFIMREMLTVICPILYGAWSRISHSYCWHKYSACQIYVSVCECVCVWERESIHRARIQLTQFWLTFRCSCRSGRNPTRWWWSWVVLVYHWMSNSYFVSVLKLCLEVFYLLAVHLQPWHDLNQLDNTFGLWL
jgi:hypothetical protein